MNQAMNYRRETRERSQDEGGGPVGSEFGALEPGMEDEQTGYCDEREDHGPVDFLFCRGVVEASVNAGDETAQYQSENAGVV